MTITKYNAAQLQVARDTITIAHTLGVNPGSAVERALIAVQIVESSLRGPIWFGDNAVTKGAYQQKDTWVQPTVRNDWMDPRRTLAGGTFLFLYGGYAAGQPGFYGASMWWKIPLGDAIQAVQQSGNPSAYAKVLDDATAIVSYLQSHPNG